MAKKPTAAPEKKPATNKQSSKAIVPSGGRKLANKPSAEETAALIGADAGVGQEEMDRNDYAIPRLKVLQDLSPQVKKTEQGYIKGSEAGQFCDPISERIWDGEQGLLVIPISYRRSHIEWKLREKGGGFVADHGPDGKILELCTKNDRNQMILPNGNQITVNAEYFVFVVDPETGEFTPYVLGLSGSQLKKSRRWNTMINQLRVENPANGQMINPAIFYRAYRLSSEPERNEQGSWFGVHITPAENTLDLPDGTSLYLAAREFRNAVTSGAVKAHAPSSDQQDGGAASDDSPM